MLRTAGTVGALMMICAACGSASGIEPQAAPTASNSTFANQTVDATATSVAPTITLAATTTIAATTTLEPTTTEAATTVVPTEAPEPTIYRPEPIWEGDQVTVMLQPAEGVALENSSVTVRIVELPDGRFLEVDLTNAVVPLGAAFWTTEINGRLKLKTTARQGSTQGSRVDRAFYGESFIVRFSGTTVDGQVLATTGDIYISE